MNLKLSKSQILLFTQSINALLNAGLSLQNSLLICENMNNIKQQRLLCSNLLKEINNGNLLSTALAKYSKDFGNFYISLVKIGEESCSMPDVFKKLTEYLLNRKRIHDKLVQSLTYPVIVCITAFIVIGIVVVFVFPKLEIIFEAFVDNSIQLRNNIVEVKLSFIVMLIILIALASISVLTSFIKQYNYNFHLFIDKVLIRSPYIGKFIKTLDTNDFCFSMKLLLLSSVPLDIAVSLSANMVNNLAYKEALITAKEEIIRGTSFSKSFNKKIFPSYFITWISLSEETGDVISTFEQLDDYYKNETTNILTNIIIKAEPIFILITGGIIFLLIVQLVLPIFRLLGTL